MKPKNKGWFHVIVALAAAAELFTASTKARKLLIGICFGYHAQAAYTHFTTEDKRAEVNGLFWRDVARLRKQSTY